MSQQKVATKSVGLFRFPGIVHFIVVLIVTGIELIGLIGWLTVAQGGNLSTAFGLSILAQLDSLITSVGRGRFAAVFLGTFLVVEHIISQIDHTGRGVSGREFLDILVFSGLEVVIWAIWFLLIPVNGLLAILFFLGSLFVEHQISDNVKKGLPFLHFAGAGSRVFLGLVLFTIFEVVGAAVWVAESMVVALAVGSTVEHYVARNVGQIRE